MQQPKFRWVSVGAGFAIVVWILASLVFGVYVANFGSYNETYGALGGVIILLLWLWLTNVALLLGAEVDAELEPVATAPGRHRGRRRSFSSSRRPTRADRNPTPPSSTSRSIKAVSSARNQPVRTPNHQTRHAGTSSTMSLARYPRVPDRASMRRAASR